MFSTRMIIGLLVLLIGTGIVAGGIFASTAGSTVSESRAGSGQGAISGYDVSNVHYELDSSDPTVISEVTFTADPAPLNGTTIQVRFVSSGSDWYSCTYVSEDVSCAVTSPSVTLSEIDELTVVAAQ